jgi:hypothetical protein
MLQKWMQPYPIDDPGFETSGDVVETTLFGQWMRVTTPKSIAKA